MSINIIGLKELRANTGKYITQVEKGKSFVVVKKSTPIFQISPVNEDSLWEEIADFTKIKKEGIPFSTIISRLKLLIAEDGQNR